MRYGTLQSSCVLVPVTIIRRVCRCYAGLRRLLCWYSLRLSLFRTFAFMPSRELGLYVSQSASAFPTRLNTYPISHRRWCITAFKQMFMRLRKKPPTTDRGERAFPGSKREVLTHRQETINRRVKVTGRFSRIHNTTTILRCNCCQLVTGSVSTYRIYTIATIKSEYLFTGTTSSDSIALHLGRVQ